MDDLEQALKDIEIKTRFEELTRVEKSLRALLQELTAHPNVPTSVQLAAGNAQNVLEGVA